MPTELHADDLHCRAIALKPETADENTRSVEAVLATDAPVLSTDMRSGKGVFEVWRMDGAEFEARTSLFDNHNRSSIRNVMGSITDCRVEGGQLIGRLGISEAEPNVWTKVREGHIRDVSGGIAPIESETVPRGQMRSVRGVSYTAPHDRELNVITRWRLREVSLTPIGADPRAKIRSEGVLPMNEKTRQYLESIGLRADATPEAAQAFYDALDDGHRKLADAGGEAAQPPAKPETQRTDPPALTETQRVEVASIERKRIGEINRLGAGLPEATIRQAIDEGWTAERYAPAFLEAVRGQRAPSAGGGGPAIHSRGHDDDCNVAALGMGLAMRHVSGDALYKLRAAYVPDCEGSNSFHLRKVIDEGAHAKAMERLLDAGDRYRGMSLHDICREACRLDGNPVSLHLGPEETFRTAVSGAALLSIFTTNINAMFLTGYMDYADTTVGWVSESDVANFLTNERATMGKFGSLTKAKKGSPADHLDTGDSKESYKIGRYTGQFVIDEQDVVNDRFGALEQESPKDMGLTAAQLRPNLVYSQLLANAALDADSTALFHANHSNLATSGSALSADNLQAAITAMGKQRIKGRVLNIKPRFLIVPQDLRWTAAILLTSGQRIIASGSGGTANPLLDVGITIVQDDRIGVGGCYDPVAETQRAGTATNYFLAGRPGEEGAKTIEVGYLRGSGRAPQIRSFILDKGQWGMGWDIKHDIGAKALDFRALYKATGAA